MAPPSSLRHLPTAICYAGMGLILVGVLPVLQPGDPTGSPALAVGGALLLVLGIVLSARTPRRGP
jgi:drug/metabolite transporter (DMT)-like permease